MIRSAAITTLFAFLSHYCHTVVSQSTSSEGVTVQSDWVLPSRPDKADYFLSGDKITVEWTSNLYTWFSDYAPLVDPTECDLWITGWELHQYEHQVARRVDAQARTSIDWVINLPAADLNATEWWVFRFTQVNANTTLEGLSISSPGFGVREGSVPPKASTETVGPSSSEATTTSTHLVASTSSADADAAITAEASEGSSRATAGLSAGAKAGIGVGVAAGVLILTGAGWFFGKKRGNKPRQEAAGESKAEKPLMADPHNRTWVHGRHSPPATISQSEVRYAELETPERQGVSELSSQR